MDWEALESKGYFRDFSYFFSDKPDLWFVIKKEEYDKFKKSTQEAEAVSEEAV